MTALYWFLLGVSLAVCVGIGWLWVISRGEP